jgi:mannitol-1-/sugar-/sorbitol-6-phosphatase
MAAPHPVEAFAGHVFDAVLFDLDGTLIDSRVALERSWGRWAQEEQVDLFALQGSHGMPAAEIVARLVPAPRVEAALARIIHYETTETEGVVARPGSRESLAALPHGTAALVTSCTRPIAAARAGAARLTLPAAVVTFDDVRRGKPAPDPFLAGAAALGLDPARCLVVEDAPAGLTGARAAGCATLAVDGTHHLDELDADAAVPDLSHLRFELRAGGVTLTRG